MTLKVILGTVVIIFALLFGVQQLISNREKKERTQRGRVAAAIEDARAQNRTEATLSAPIGYYASVKSLDDALAHYTTLIAEPIAQVSRMDQEGKGIETWYKFRVIEFLSQPKDGECRTCVAAKVVPTELQPVEPNELLLPRNIGTITSEGITVTVKDENFPTFEPKKKYFLFVLFDAATRVAALDLGPAGVHVVEADGQMSPISSKASKLNDELRSRYRNIDRARTGLRFRRFPE